MSISFSHYQCLNPSLRSMCWLQNALSNDFENGKWIPSAHKSHCSNNIFCTRNVNILTASQHLSSLIHIIWFSSSSPDAFQHFNTLLDIVLYRHFFCTLSYSLVLTRLTHLNINLFQWTSSLIKRLLLLYRKSLWNILFCAENWVIIAFDTVK